MSVTRLADLAFGLVLTGDVALVAQSDPTAAQFQVDGPRATPLFVSFQLPASAQRPGATVPLSFGPADAAWSDKDRLTGRTTFDPTQGTQVLTPNNGRIYVWLGGTATVPTTAAPGGYTGTITMTVVVN